MEMDILHPHLLSKQQLLDIFHQRHFTIPRLDELSRDELICLYTKHLLPLPRRSTTSANSTSNDVDMDEASPNKSETRRTANVRPRIVYSDESPMDNVRHGVKRIRLVHSSSSSNDANSSGTSFAVKRSPEVTSSGSTNKTVFETAATPSKRKKITWP
ncbi:uncharacterized protein LOC129762219 [Toxorhynchites rutilus septentrionalis]|uniref:uncharacterized protein LOC129762219 n=1 Tax=Toxorhynchites rutilus septentrionalis TaxID=329112 RepID=UPI00247A7A75|nr:uncharacterized protein LOC129762219 [Toxorhynchites rutilus septentrionalis]